MVSQDQEEEKDVLMGGLDVDHSTRIITLESKNGQMLKADAQVLKQSKLFKVALEEGTPKQEAQQKNIHNFTRLCNLRRRRL